MPYLDLSIYSKNIALLFSGGVESTLLLYLMDASNKLTDHKISVYIIDRPNKPIYKAQRIFNKICSHRHLNILSIPTVEYWKQIPTATSILADQYDTIIWGINKYPADLSIRPKHIFNFKETDKLKLPFKNLDKIQTINAFYELDIDYLLPLTHSCGLANDQPCGECFNCKERIWAYKSLGLKTNLGC